MNILWKHTDGSMATTHLAPDAGDPKKHAAELLERGDMPKEYTPVAFSVSGLPHNWPLEVWDWQGGKVILHMTKAREWHKARLRRERVVHFAALDVQSLRNTESGADNAPTLKAKQALRDVTKKVDAAKDWDAMTSITIPTEQSP